MHNTMKIILSHINDNVPEMLLRLAYNPNNLPVGIDQLIHSKTIMNRVYLYCNLLGGKRKEIIVTYDMRVVTYSDPRQEALVRMGSYAVYEIPPQYRDNRPIVSVVGLGYPNQAINYPWDQCRPTSGANVAKMMKAVLTSHTMSGSVTTPDVDLISGSRIMISPPQYADYDWVLSCNVAYDENFNGLNRQAVLALQDICLSAVKSHIYNKLVLEVDQGLIIYGGELGTAKELIYEYKEEEEKFQDQLTRFSGAAMLDLKKKLNLIRNMV